MIENTKKILIIDDDDVDRMIIKKALKESGMDADIFSAADIETGSMLAFEEEFACIFLDYNLPGNNGFIFLDDYKNKNGIAPIILVTSFEDENIAEQAAKKGAKGFILKNQISSATILDVLNSTESSSSETIALTENTNQYSLTDLHDHSILDHLPIVIFSLDANGIFTSLKGAGLKTFKIYEKYLIGKSIYELGLQLPIRLQDYKNALCQNNYTACIEQQDCFYQIQFVHVMDTLNCVTGINGVVVDITSIKKNEQELKNTLAASEETQKIKASFLANMSHEVRTPIHGIMNLTDILLKTKITDEQLKYLDAIKKSADNLSVIINDILDLSKIEAQKMRFENTQFNLHDIVHSITEVFKPRAEEKKIKLDLDYDEKLSEFLNGDSVRLSQVINNLLSNAIKFTHEGTVKLEVLLEEQNENFCLVTFKVSDTGIGIPQHKLTSIFDSFSQAGDDITRKYGGTGLGLNICKQLVELQGGMITVESTLNKGSVFIFKLPFESIVFDENNLSDTTKLKTETAFNKELKILVVEDNDINRMVINIMARELNFKTDNAINGSLAIEMIEQNNYDVILMDIEMPGMNGYQTTEYIRQKLTVPKNSTPILAMTAHANTSEKDKCLEAGMNDYVSKPFDQLELKNKIIALYETSQSPEVKLSKSEPAIISNERLTNLTFLRQLADNNDTFFKDFILLFMQNAPQTISDLESSLKNKDWNGVRQAAHKIKPTLSYLGMKESHLAALRAEECARNTEHLEELPDLINKIKNACNKAYQELEQELKTISI